MTPNSLLVLDFRGFNLDRWLVLDLAPQLAASSQAQSLPFEFRALEAILQQKVRPGDGGASWACSFRHLTPDGDLPVSSGLVTCVSVNRWTPCRPGWARWSLWYWTHWNPWWIPKSCRPTGVSCTYCCRVAKGETQRAPPTHRLTSAAAAAKCCISAFLSCSAFYQLHLRLSFSSSAFSRLSPLCPLLQHWWNMATGLRWFLYLWSQVLCSNIPDHLTCWGQAKWSWAGAGWLSALTLTLCIVKKSDLEQVHFCWVNWSCFSHFLWAACSHFLSGLNWHDFFIYLKCCCFFHVKDGMFFLGFTGCTSGNWHFYWLKVKLFLFFSFLCSHILFFFTVIFILH